MARRFLGEQRLQSPEPCRDENVFELTCEELDALPFGVVTLSRQGKILRYNRAEETLARRAAQTTVGRDFFTDVAPCANVQAFRGRFDAFARGVDSGVEQFDFSFHFRWGRHDVSINMLRKAAHDEINVLVRGRVKHDEGKLVPFERRHRVGRVEPAHTGWGSSGRSLGLASPPPTVYRLGEPEEVHFRSRTHVDDIAAVTRALAEAARDRVAYAIEYRIVRSDHSIAVVAETGLFPSEPDAAGYATIVDVSARRTIEEEHWRAAHHDALTGLPNQRCLLQRIGIAVNEAKAANRLAAVLVTNVDRFRESNDMFGRDICNELLKLLALRLGECIRAGDTVARLGGDLFAVLLTDVATRATIAETVKRLSASIAKPFLIDGRSYHLTLSVGIGVAPDDGVDPDKVLRASYTAMGAAKVDGQGGMCWYTGEMSVDAANNARRRTELRAALENDELILHYQPIVDIAQNRIIAVESLVRWNHPSRGLVPPAEFIALADKSGLIIPLGEWVLRAACRQAREWCDRGFDLRVCVNVSPIQFRQPNFVPLVAEILAETDLDPDRLELELTESVMVDGFGAMMETLGRLKSMGLRLAIDDFGTGYSSLSYLKYFPIDTLKIDRAFIIDIAVDQFDRAIATAVLTLARELNLDCVVEGVETREQIDALSEIGCTTMQGYYFSRPVTAAKLEEVLAGSSVLQPLTA